MKFLRSLMKVFTRQFWAVPFPKTWDDDCFVCNKGCCDNCPNKPGVIK